MTPVQTLYRWFNDNPEATYKEALEAYEHCLELEQQLPQQEISDEEILKAAKEYENYNEYDSELQKEASSGKFHGFLYGIKWYREQLKQK